MPSLYTSGPIIVDASTLAKSKLGRKVAEVIKERNLETYISETLEMEYDRAARRTGLGPLTLQKIYKMLNPRRIRNKNLPSIASGFKDAHLINLARHVKASIIISEDKDLIKKAPHYGVKAITGKRFLKDC